MSSSVRFVHCSGFRFDSRTWEGPVSWINMRDQDLWKTFEAVLKLCRTERADFLFLTGDLFEQEYVTKETIESIARGLGRLKGTRVFITPGEKDPLLTASAYRFTEWPGNVHIFHGGMSKVTIPSQRVTIYGSGWSTYKQEMNYLESFQAADNEEQIQFMLLHAEVESTENTKGFIPLQLDQIAASGLTYLALGHKDNWSGVQEAGDTYWADCGSAEARGFSECGPNGVLLGETDGKSTQIEFVELGQRRYIEKSYPLLTDTKDMVAQLLADTTDQERKKDLFRIKISASLQETEAVSQTLQKLLTDKFSYFEILSLTEINSSSSLNNSVTLIGLFMNEIQMRLVTVRSPEEQRHWELVQKIGVTALTQGQINGERQRISELNDVALDSLARAKKRVEEQAESMEQLKADYNVLRRDWETANRRQEEQRLLQIEIKNLKAKENHVNEKIANIIKIQERLELLHQNPDYRELRRIQGELPRLKEQSRKTKAELSAYTRNTQVDWNMIEGLRKEYLNWALLQEKINILADDIQLHTQTIYKIENDLQMSGYQELPENEDQRLLQLYNEWNAAQEELERLTPLLDEIINTEEILNKEIANLNDTCIAGLTPEDERKISHTVQILTKWQKFRLSGFIDRSLKNQFDWSSIEDRLTSHLASYFQKYQVADYEELKSQQQTFHNQHQVVKRLQSKLVDLHIEAKRMKNLRRIAHSHNQTLQTALSKVYVSDLTEWLNGWENYNRTKSQLAEMHNELDIKTELQHGNEEKLIEYVNQLREKVKNWASPSSNIDEVLHGVILASSKLRAKEEAEKEFIALKQGYNIQLGKRDMNELVKVLEPLADLEREECQSDEERQTELLTCHQELARIKHQLSNAAETIERSQLTMGGIRDLEKKIETIKLQRQTYDELQRALDTTQELLEALLGIKTI